ncbi:DUF86 domain-containing protein [Flavobacterium sp. NG2]|uniref:HepT-like ribonuclease domain-containing protein n=1 Tax=Flavobacterium sp. NG2 TaxID=3097547 RepID=UPI002A803F77|nr:DUF86 domain-containing protein [Flavobacterium sp. NG2]WPR72187.1 DUF86 domain-containing protein [Flavobacterium sp. NG2]
MSKDPKEFLRHIIDECSYIVSVSKNLTFDNFVEDETLKRAVVRSLEIIGEATKKIPADFKDKWKTIQWKNMAGMRDRLIHDYMGVNYSIVWDVMKNKIPEIHKEISSFLSKE